MKTYFLLSFGLISFVLFSSFISCSSIFLPINDISYYQNDQYSPMINNDDIRIISPNHLTFNRYQRSSSYYPRKNRNTWFRVSTYQHFKPSRFEETHNGDHLMRWGR